MGGVRYFQEGEMIKKIAKKIGKKKSSKKTSAGKATRARKPARTKKRRTLKKVSQEQLQDMISMKAYEIYEQKGGFHGDDMSDWLQAEKLVASRVKVK
jgi:hypothetical protein